MIPILFRPGTTSFTTNGEGRLTNCRRCEVAEERNGQYECLFEYPKTGPLFGKITQGSIIFATHDNGGVPQPFVVYSRSAPLEGFVTFRASHISYQLSNVIVAPFMASSCAAAIAGIKTNSITTNPFTFWTDKSVNGSFAVNIPKSARAILGGSSGSLLDTFGKGEYEFDVYTVKLYTNRGADRGVSIRYGKNLAKLNQEISSANSYNAVVPYWVGADEIVSLDHVVYSGHPLPGVEEYSELVTDAGDNIQTDASDDILVGVGYKTVALDLSEYFDEAPTQAQLEAKAISLMEKNEPYEIKENIKLDFVQMWQTEEYKNYENLQKVYLCDTVHIFYEPLGITATAKCIKTVYDTLKERYISIELGEPRTTLTETVQSMINTSTQALPSKDMMAAAIDHATELISGGFGGYIKYHYLSDGTPSEMLIMDSPDEATATNIIRLNQNGLGFSTDGGATYANAWTIDGHLNASFITTGTLIASLIKTGLLQDQTGKNYWNLDTGQFVTALGKLGLFDIDDDGLTYNGVSNKVTIDPDGVVYSDGSTWRVRFQNGVIFERYKNNEWVEAARIDQAEASQSGISAFHIYVDGNLVAQFKRYTDSGGIQNWIRGDLFVSGTVKSNGNGTETLWTGNLQTSSTVSVPYGDYSEYIIEGKPSGGSAPTITMVIPKSAIPDTAKWYTLTDGAGDCQFTALYSGTQAFFAYVNSSGGGMINAIYGLK